MFATKLAGAAGALLLAATLSPALAQTSPSATGSAGESQSGTTSGPAAGTPTTLGTSGSTTATPHQRESVKEQSSSITRGEKQEEGSGSSAAPQGTAGQPSAEGNQGGPAPKRGSTE